MIRTLKAALGRRWRYLYGKVRADIAGSLATGGLSVGVLAGLEYAGVETSPEQKTAIAAVAGWIGGKAAAIIRPETHPAGPAQIPAPAPTPPSTGTRPGL